MKTSELSETTIAKCWQCSRPAHITCTKKGKKAFVCNVCMNSFINKMFGLKNNSFKINLK